MGCDLLTFPKLGSGPGVVIGKFLSVTLVLFCLFSVASPAIARDDEKPLQIFFIDVEGGQATLFITPDGQSLLVDTGWPGSDGRDADRIVRIAKQAGLSRINYVLITHYHMDHVGGLPQLVARIPVETLIDHGENREPNDPETNKVWEAYQKLLASNKFSASPPSRAIFCRYPECTQPSSAPMGRSIESPLPGAGAPNPACKESETRPADQTENLRSLGILVEFGKLRILDLGDLTWDKEMELMCPLNKIGKVGIYIVSHHGWQQSGSPALVHGIEPRVAIMDNGAKKGGSPSSWDIIKHSPHLEDIWQLHFSDEGGKDHNSSEQTIANPDGPDAGNYLRVNGNIDGSFSVFNSRTNKAKHY